MHPTLLSTKLFFPPARPTIVPRSRLVERLQDGLEGPFTLISSPPGSGKSTLLSEWRSGPGSAYPVAWVSLDSLDNDVVQFYLYLAASLDTIHPGALQVVEPLLESVRTPPPEVVITPLINLLGECSTDFVLALDDYHTINMPDIHKAVIFLLEHLPPAMHLVILTRSDPPFPLARLRARGQMTEIRAEHLSFTEEECAQFLEQVMGLSLTRDQVRALEKRTEGWIAGLQLAALSMQGRDDLEGFVSAFTGSHHYIMDYLAEEVLNRLPDTLRDFLLKTSILDRLNGDLCDFITGLSGCNETLADLHRLNLFVIPLDDEHCWYRYHHLFGDLLYNRLKALLPQEIPELNRQAALWFDSHGYVDEAIDHALESEDYPLATRLFRKNKLQVMYTRNLDTLHCWLQEFPDETILQDPWMCIAHGHVLWSRGQPEKVTRFIEGAQKALLKLAEEGQITANDPEYQVLWGESLSFQSLIALYAGDFTGAVGLAKQAVSMLPGVSLSRGFALGSLYSAYRAGGNLDLFIETCLEAIDVTREANYPSMYTSTVYSLVEVMNVKGQLQRALEISQECLEHGEKTGQSRIFYYGIVHIGMANIYLEWNDLEAAEHHLKTGLDLIRRGGTSILLPAVVPVAVPLAFAQGGPQQALETLAELHEECKQLSRETYETVYMLLRTKYQMLSGENVTEEALRMPVDWDHPGRLTPALALRAEIYSTQQIASGKLDEALDFLRKVDEFSISLGITAWQIDAQVLQALAWEEKKEIIQAKKCLGKALLLAEPGGYIRIMVEKGEPVRKLLEEMLPQLEKWLPADSLVTMNAVRRYAARLLSEFPQPSPVGGSRETPSLLSERERELLGLIAAGRSNKEIAAELYIAIGTVKRHTVNIFTKLDVSNRTEAVAKARQIGIL